MNVFSAPWSVKSKKFSQKKKSNFQRKGCVVTNTTLNFPQALQNHYSLLELFFQKSFVLLTLDGLYFVWKLSYNFTKFCCDLGLNMDFKIFVSHSKFQTDKASFREHWFYHNSAESFKIRKYKKNYEWSFNTSDDSLSWECGPSPFWIKLISSVTWIS